MQSILRFYVQPRVNLSSESLKKGQSQQLAKIDALKSFFFVSPGFEVSRKSSNLQLGEPSSQTYYTLALYFFTCSRTLFKEALVIC